MKPALRPEKIVINLSPSEKKQIERMAMIYGMPTAVYARVAVLGYISDDCRGLKVPNMEAENAERSP